MTRILLSLLLLGSLLVSLAKPASAEPAFAADAPRPNVLLILLDDLGYGQLGFTGHEIIETPHIDQLARDGARFANGYAGSTVCSPSRISLLTGRDTSRLWSAANTIALRPHDRTLAHVLQHAGYRTALFGKFGVGTQFGQTDPLVMGFDHWVGLLHNVQAHRQHPKFLFVDNEMKFLADNLGDRREGYAQRIFTDAALAFLNEQTDAQPFFAFVSYTSPHSEMYAPEEFVAPYRGRFQETPYNGLAGPTPADQFPQYYPEPIEEPNAVQAGMVAALDAYIGELLASLEERGLAENTLVILSSDNGPHSEGGGDPVGLAAAGPFRGGKRDLTEGGIHVPLVIRWPAAVEAGRVIEDPVHFADVLPTLADLAGVPEASAALGANGHSLAPLLTDKGAALPERMLYWAFQRQLGDPNSGTVGVIQQAGRIGHWKALRIRESDPVQLYDLRNDPGEATDLAAKHPEVAADFTQRFDAALEMQEKVK